MLVKPNKFFTCFLLKIIKALQLHKASAQLRFPPLVTETSTIKMTSVFFFSTKKKEEIISYTDPFRRGNALNPMENS